MRRFARFGIICDVLRDLIHYVQFKKREKHPWKSATFLKVTLPHGFFSRFLNSTNGTKLRNLSHMHNLKNLKMTP